jgi:hypothetical protein
MWSLDLSGDGGRAEVAYLFQPYEGYAGLGYLQVAAPGWPVWTSRRYQAWGAWVGDVDEDGRLDVILGIWSFKPRGEEPLPRKTVWVLSWDGVGFFERWRGSALSASVQGVTVADLDGDGVSDLIALEVMADTAYVKVYRWNEFGFVVRARLRLQGSDWRLREDAPVLCQMKCSKIKLDEGRLALVEF